ncbi:MAG TPA: 3-dehydroquinate synthase [Vicinamibacteria bacterium]|nr:3-dehydroquinate synthase [Vicinamibacteria bacterium]
MLEIPVELGPRRYLVSVGEGLARRLPERLADLRGRKVALVASRRVFGLHGRPVRRALAALGPVHVVLAPDGERHKGQATLQGFYDAFLQAKLGRDGVVVAFGGGVVGDVAGYAAATYMRGVDWVGLPTTLLSMVDSSVGGKVGINHPRGKNLIGAFHQPRAVVIDPAFLATLPPRELRSGAYEVLKCGILGDPALFEVMRRAPAGLRGWEGADVELAIAAACRLKAEVVTKDEREGGLRRVLNLGHTLGHALEAVTRYRRYTHGEAVGWGLVGVSHLARARGLLDAASHEAILAAVDRIGPRPRVSDLPSRDVLAALARDKKARAGRVPFILPAAVGRVEIHDDVSPDEVRRALREMGSHGTAAATSSSLKPVPA